MIVRDLLRPKYFLVSGNFFINLLGTFDVSYMYTLFYLHKKIGINSYTPAGRQSSPTTLKISSLRSKYGKGESYSNKFASRVQKRGYNTAKVKILLNKNNPQVTNPSYSVVGTSEAIRCININKRSIHNLSNSDRDLKFKQ